MPAASAVALAASSSPGGREGDTAVTASARSPSSLAATAATRAESAPPEKATTTLSISAIVELRRCAFSESSTTAMRGILPQEPAARRRGSASARRGVHYLDSHFTSWTSRSRGRPWGLWGGSSRAAGNDDDPHLPRKRRADPARSPGPHLLERGGLHLVVRRPRPRGSVGSRN